MKRGASVLKRRKSRNRMEAGPSVDQGTPTENRTAEGEASGDNVFFTDEQRNGT